MSTVVQSFDSHWAENHVTGCWDWKRGKYKSGYGALRANGKPQYAHRFSWERVNGPVPDGLHVLHHCDNRACINPTHLFLGSNDDNIADKVKKGRSRNGVSLGEKHGCAKLSSADVGQIRSLLKNGIYQTDIAKKFSVSQSLVSCIARGALWSHQVS